VSLLLGRTLVVSPHLDDAILSLGASIGRATGSGRRVTVLTVFAGRPDSARPAGGWDSRGGFATEGDASKARRLEDEQACRAVGAELSWLPFSEADYRETLDGDSVWSAVNGAVTDARPEDVLLPGFPLTNPDHAWVTELLMERGLPCSRLGLYAEQPYRFWACREDARSHGDAGPMATGLPVEWVNAGRSLREVWRKRRAIVAYRSQIRLLGMSRRHTLNRMLLDETLRGGEAIRWLQA
jgi:LmbE family N-acetylglucosaminyl deacetylase